MLIIRPLGQILSRLLDSGQTRLCLTPVSVFLSGKSRKAQARRQGVSSTSIIEEEGATDDEMDWQDQTYRVSQEPESEVDPDDDDDDDGNNQISDEDLAPEKRRKKGETRALMENLRDCNRELSESGVTVALGKRKASRCVVDYLRSSISSHQD